MVVRVILHGLRGEKMEIELCDTVEQFKSITVLQLREKIIERCPNYSHIPAENLQLIFTDKLLNDDCCLVSEYGIQDMSVIHMVVRVPGGGHGPEKGDGGMGDKGGTNRIKIVGEAQTKTREKVVPFFIKLLNGTNITIKLYDSEFQSCTVLQLKTELRRIEGIPEDQQQLAFLGKELEDDRTLSECGIKKESTVHLLLRLGGGGPVPEEGDGEMGDKGGTNRSMEKLFLF